MELTLDLYRGKLAELESVLESMGKDPTSVSQWVFDEVSEGSLRLDAVRAAGARTISLIKSIPASQGSAMLGARFSDPARADHALAVLKNDEQSIAAEMRDIERIEKMVHVIHSDVGVRLDAVKRAAEVLDDQYRAGGENSQQAYDRVHLLTTRVIPILSRLEYELENAVRFLEREYLARSAQIDLINSRQLRKPRYNQRARRKRLARAAARAKREAEEKEAKEGSS
jgi:hypothetical protein